MWLCVGTEKNSSSKVVICYNNALLRSYPDLLVSHELVFSLPIKL